jgi:hypothetical protein
LSVKDIPSYSATPAHVRMICKLTSADLTIAQNIANLHASFSRGDVLREVLVEHPRFEQEIDEGASRARTYKFNELESLMPGKVSRPSTAAAEIQQQIETLGKMLAEIETSIIASPLAVGSSGVKQSVQNAIALREVNDPMPLPWTESPTSTRNIDEFIQENKALIEVFASRSKLRKIGLSTLPKNRSAIRAFGMGLGVANAKKSGDVAVGIVKKLADALKH